MRTIAIVGAGFSGTATAIHLLRRSRKPLRVVLVDDRSDPAAGLAYSGAQQDCLLNVPAGQMSLDAGRPGDFVAFAASRGACVHGEDFLPRALYGRYLWHSLREASASADMMDFTRLWGRAVRLTQSRHRTASWRIDLDDGHLVLADEVVLAVGNPRPARLAQLQAVFGTSWYVHDPWGSWPADWPRNTRPVMLVGTGLTMADVALRLASKSPDPPQMIALSRRGRLPQAQTEFDRASVFSDIVASIRGGGGSLRHLVRTVRALSDRARDAGGDWREVVTAVRRIAPELWARLSDADRRRFLRHLRPLWDSHRHRLPPAAADGLARLQAAGKLIVWSGALESTRITGEGIEVSWRPRGGVHRERCVVGRIFNCTGPDYRPARSESELVRSLLASGLIAPDPLALGIRVAADGEVIGADGRIVKGLYYVGPWLRARDWEATAVPELREHARRLAERLADAVVNGRRQESASGPWQLAERAAAH